MKIITVVGARPQFVKAATVSRAIIEHNKTNPSNAIEELIVHTGQHYDANMSDVFFDEMEIPKPDYTLNIGGGNHGLMTGRQLEKVEEVLIKESPDCVLVYGDTNSTLAGALAAVKLHIPVVHVEAGLRSFNMNMPEEVNRILTDQISSVLFCPTQTALNNLMKEGFSDKKVEFINVGDVMYDAALHYLSSAKKPSQLNLNEKFALATFHRAENTDDKEKLKNIVSALNKIHEDLPVVCPIHPRTKKLLNQLNIKPNFIILEPVSYFEMLWLLINTTVVLTDSGGLQKEAFFFDKNCITLREQTEWVELVNEGVNKLVGSDYHKIIDAFMDLRKRAFSFDSSNELYGKGVSAELILKKIISNYA